MEIIENLLDIDEKAMKIISKRLKIQLLEPF